MGYVCTSRQSARPALPLLFSLAACLPTYEPSNPYDPQTPLPEQAKATVPGTVTQAAATTAAAVPLNEASIVLTGPGESEASQTLVTDTNGTFRFRELTPGSYTLSVTQASLYSNVFTLSLSPGQTLNCPVTLTPIAVGAGARPSRT